MVVFSGQIVSAAQPAGVSPASTKVTFGAKLTTNTQPSNAGPAHHCNTSSTPEPCSWVMNQAYSNAGHEGAPRDGTIVKIRVIAAQPGSFQLQLVKTKPSGVSIVKKNGPVITYQGQPDNISDYLIESFSVSIPVRQGWRLAEKASSTSTLRCDSGGSRSLQFDPPLALGAAGRSPDDTDGCFMLIQAIEK
jgi:hypothetical protein